MQIVFVTFPFFALIGLGYLAGWRRILPEAGIQGLVAFVFYAALPCLLFRAMAERAPHEIFDAAFMGAYLAAGLFVFAGAAITAAALFGAGMAAVGLYGQAATVGNVGFLALPMITGLLGPEAQVPVILAWFIDLIVLVPLAIALMEGGRRHEGGFWTVIWRTARGAIMNPFVISIVLGVGFSATGLTLPGPVDQVVEMLATAAGPCALFALGGTLAFRPLAGDMLESASMVAAKLVVHPTVMFMAMWLTGVPPLWAHAAVLTAAAPVAANVYLISQKYGVRPGRASSAILLSTAVSLGSFTLMASVVMSLPR